MQTHIPVLKQTSLKNKTLGTLTKSVKPEAQWGKSQLLIPLCMVLGYNSPFYLFLYFRYQRKTI
jgi:hypothetical protein